MNNQSVTQLVPTERVESLIHLARGEKVLLDADLAMLYGVTTGALNRAVKRNATRFPKDFMFQLTAEEAEILKCQIGISSMGHGGRRRSLPYAFTEQGVAMLSSVLRSERAVQVNVAIMRAFVGLRRLLATNEVLARKLAELERRLEGHDQAIKSLFDAIREMMAPPAKPQSEIDSEPGTQTRRAFRRVLIPPAEVSRRKFPLAKTAWCGKYYTTKSMFGTFIKELRARRRLGLREFCLEHGHDPSNWSKIEREVLTPPRDEETLRKWAKQLGLKPGSDDWHKFHDYAAVDAGRIPNHVLKDEELLAKLPAFFRTISSSRPTRAKLEKLMKLLREC